MKYGKKKESNVSDEKIIRESGKKKNGEFVKKGKEREEEKVERRKNN